MRMVGQRTFAGETMFRPSGTGANSEAAGEGASATGNDATSFGSGATSNADDASSFGRDSSASLRGSSFGANSESAINATAAGQLARARAATSAAFGYSSLVDPSHGRGIALGPLSATTRANQCIVGASDVNTDLSLYGRLDYIDGDFVSGTVGAAGSGAALPATPEEYIEVLVNGNIRKIPVYLT